MRVDGPRACDCVYGIACKRIFTACGNAQVARVAQWRLVVVGGNTDRDHRERHQITVTRMGDGLAKDVRPRFTTSSVCDGVDQLSKIVVGVRPSLASVSRSWISAPKYKFADLYFGIGCAWRVCVAHSSSQIGMGSCRHGVRQFGGRRKRRAYFWAGLFSRQRMVDRQKFAVTAHEI